MKLDNPTEFRRERTATLEASDFPRRELIEPRLAKLKLELGTTYAGTATSPFLLEALTISTAVALRTLTLSRFQFEVPTRLLHQRELAAFGARFGFKDLEAWAAFCRSASLSMPKMAMADQRAYCAFLYHLIGENRSLGLQLSAVLGHLLAMKKSPVLSRSQVETFMRLHGQPGMRIDSKLTAYFLAGFTLVETIELLGSNLDSRKLEQALRIRVELGYEASAGEIIQMLATTNNVWITSLLDEGVTA